MDHVKILKQAWDIMWQYRALWIFGIILALTTASWSGSGAGNPPSGGGGNGEDAAFRRELPEDMQEDFGELIERTVEETIPPEIISMLIAIGIGLACMAVFLFIASRIARYVGETALLRMVDDYEDTGEQRSIGQGFRLGWSRAAWRLFFIDLVIDIPTILVVIVLFLLVGAPLLLWISGDTASGLVGTIAAIGLFFVAIVLVIILGTALKLLKRFFRRACALEGLGVFPAIRRGYAVVRQNLKDVGLMWLIMVGVSIGWPIVLVPVVFLLLAVGAVLGGGAALLFGGLSTIFLDGAAPWILGGAAGVPLFLLILVAPLLFLSGLREVFQSSTWTLTYRELLALESLGAEKDTPALEAAA